MSAVEAPPVTPGEAGMLFADLEECPSLVLAVSGGPDSTALMALAAGSLLIGATIWPASSPV